jgi:type IV pilus assembly protein PilA
MWLYSLGYMIGVPIVLLIIPRVAALAVGSGVGISIYYVPYFVIAFILAPMFATRLYYAHARNQIGNIKARTPSGEEQRLEVARAGSTSVIGTIAAALLPMIALIGIITAISVPNYADYAVRAQVSEGLNLSGGAKAAVAEYYEDYKQFPSDNVAAGLPPATDIQGKYVSSVQIEVGEIVVTYGNDADSDIHGDTLVIRPEVSDQGVTFVCFSLDIVSKNLPAVCR